MIKIQECWVSVKEKVTNRFAPKHYCSACGRRLGKDNVEKMYTIVLDKEYLTLCNKCIHTLSRKLNKYLHHN